MFNEAYYVLKENVFGFVELYKGYHVAYKRAPIICNVFK
jgi:hypothetical protein